jgi:hypothetical protein
MKKHLLLLLIFAFGCQDKLLGLTDNATPLVRIHVKVTGDLQALRPPGTLQETPHLRVALVWGAAYLADPFCLLYQNLPLDPSASAVAQAGCRDDFGFVPTAVGESVALSADGTATLELINLPSAAVLIGDITSRIGYASILVFDDRDDNGTLKLHQAANRNNFGPGNGGPGGTTLPVDVTQVAKGDFVYGASFISMTQPDQRIAYLEGVFDPGNALYSLFYPRTGCDGPPAGFSILSAGGVTGLDLLKTAAGLGNASEDPATCSTRTLDSVVTIALQVTETVRDVACSAGNGGNSSIGALRYQAPNQKVPAGVTPPDLVNQPWACVPTTYSACSLGISIPGQDCSKTAAKGPLSLAVAAAPGDCKATTHYVLKGCQDLTKCDTPEWDFTTAANPPPPWWPCPIEGK